MSLAGAISNVLQREPLSSIAPVAATVNGDSNNGGAADVYV